MDVTWTYAEVGGVLEGQRKEISDTHSARSYSTSNSRTAARSLCSTTEVN